MSQPATRAEYLLLAAFGFGCGLSPAVSGFYDPSVWGPIALGLSVLALGLALARPLPRRAALGAVAALGFLWAWSWLSQGWAESADAALTEAGRWFLYAVALGVLAFLLRGARQAAVLLGAGAAGVLAIAGYVVAEMLLGDGPRLFLNGRLNDPLGYVNGEAGFFVLAFWPLVALAERRHVLASAAGVASATLLACLLVLSESRGVAVAVALSAAAMVALVPGRRRRLWALLVVCAGVAVALDPLLEVYRDTVGVAPPPTGTVRHAAAAAVLAALLAGSAWAALNLAADALTRRAGPGRRASFATGGLVAVGIAAALAFAVNAPRIVDEVHDQARAFVKLDTRRAASSRFLSGGGNRYDYWRIAVLEFGREPVRGLGAGNYDRDYFRERRTAEDVRQPHSIVLQTLAELGAVGVLALAVFFALVLAGLLRCARLGRADPWPRALAVAAGGTFLAWTVQANVDWPHLLPGLTGLALAAAAVLLRPWAAGDDDSPPSLTRARLAALVALAAVLAAGAVAVARPVMAAHLRAQAREALITSPGRALAKADDSLALNRDAVPTYYVKAAALGRRDDYLGARAVLLAAARREPHDFVTWALLGDLAFRRGDRPLAVAYYARAARLNPRDRALANTLRAARR